MPGPDGHPTLIVTGKVTLPDGRWAIAFRPSSQVMESDPVRVVVDLEATPDVNPESDPATRDVRGQWRSEAAVGSVIVMCRGTTLTRISPVETVH